MSSTPYFSSRQRSNYTPPNPNYQAAAHGNANELLRGLKVLSNRVGQLETRNGGGSISLDTSSPVSTPPPLAAVAAAASNGAFRIQITNPQFRLSGKGNRSNTPVLHKIEFSSTQDFSNSEQLPITAQTYVEVSKFPASRKWVRVSSSFDGHNFNQHQVMGPLNSGAK